METSSSVALSGHQKGITIIIPIKAGKETALRVSLDKVARELITQTLVHFCDFKTLHFFRWAIITERQSEISNQVYPASLLLSASIDGDPFDFLKTLTNLAPEGLDEVYQHCENDPGAENRLDYLLRHRCRENTFYQGHPGLTFERIISDQKLRKNLGSYCDHLEASTGEEARKLITKKAHETPEFKEALSAPPTRPLLKVSLREWLAIILLAPLSIPFLIYRLITIRISEWDDNVRTLLPVRAKDHKQSLRYEDYISQNQFTHLSEIKPGKMRLETLRIILVLVNLAGRINHARKRYLGITTLHFVKWVIVDDGKRLLFISNYDGTAIKYVSDFVDRSRGIPLALTAIWSNTVGFPPSKFLVFDGAKNQPMFLAFLRRYQIHTQVWFSAYANLSSSNILNSARFRRGLQKKQLSDKELSEWLKTI